MRLRNKRSIWSAARVRRLPTIRRGGGAQGPFRTPAAALAVVAAGSAALFGATMLIWPQGQDYQLTAGPGHGRGMSQHGALRNAQAGWDAPRILAHYYPGATLHTMGPTTVAVRLMGHDGGTLDVSAEAGARVAGRRIEPGQVAHLTSMQDGAANVTVTQGCAGEVLWQAATNDPWVYPVDPNPGRPATEHLTFCGGGAYRGSLGVAAEGGDTRVVNRVHVEDYLLGVVPAEVQANWVDKGATEAIRAQAIAARSYALSEQRYPYAQTCDTTDCQVYPGTAKEDPRSAEAIATTAGMVLLREGRILRSEYSAAPDGGRPADITTFAVGPTPAELEIATPPAAIPPPEPVVPRVETGERPSPIETEYARLGGADSTLGEPLGPELPLPEDAGQYRLFDNGVIVYTATLGAQVVDFNTVLKMVPELDSGSSG